MSTKSALRPTAEAAITTSTCTEDRLIERLAQSLDFAEQALRQLPCGAPGEADDRVATPGRPPRRTPVCPERLIAETGILLLAASAVSGYAAIGPRILRVATLLVPHARSQYILTGICFEPAQALDYAIAHICLKRVGFYDSDVDAILDMSVSSDARNGRERTPSQTLQQDWLRQSWLYPEGLIRLKSSATAALSALNRPVDLLNGTADDIRSFTHALRCITDFNHFPRQIPRTRDAILAEAEGMLARCLEEQDYGLAAEVLVSWPLTGESWSPAAAFVFRVIARAEQASTTAEHTAPTNRVVTMRSAKEVGTMDAHLNGYQATYATGVLCAASLAPDRLPPQNIPQERTRTGALEAISAHLDANATRGHWQDEFDLLEPAEQESLAEFLLSLQLHREFHRRNFAAMQRMLYTARALGLAASPLAVQATELLTRTAQLADRTDPFIVSSNGNVPIAGLLPEMVHGNGRPTGTHP